MTRKLWSINALSTEFGNDRRTVARLIRPIRPAGKLNGHDAWHIEDVAPYLATPPRKRVPADDFDPVVAAVEDRLEHWREIHSDPVVWTFDEFCENTGISRAAALVQLRAGMPYVTAGDWESGAGFTIRSAPAFDWSLLMIRALAGAGRRDLLRKLGI